MSQLKSRRTLPAVACARALHVDCPHAPRVPTDDGRQRSRWLQHTCALACRCTARFRTLLVFAGCLGIVGFCVASLGFFAAILDELQYLIAVAGALGVFATSVAIAHLGDPYALKRMQSQRPLAQREGICL